MVAFNVIHHDGLVRVKIDDAFHAVITVEGIKDIGVLVRAINRAVMAGAISATLYTGEFVNEDEGGKFSIRAAQGTTWRGAPVTRLPAGLEGGPCFRLDFDHLAPVTE